MSDATTYLQNEVRKAQRTFRVAVIAMSVVLVGFLGYFQWLKSELATVLEPDSLAEFAINQARAALPEVSGALKANLETEAPNVVRFVLHQAVDQGLPLLGESLQSHLDEHSRAVTSVADAHTSAAFERVLSQYEAERAKNRGKSGAAPIDAVAFTTFVDANYAAALDATAQDELQKILDESGGTLKHIDARLAALAKGRDASREDELGKRLITTWWTFLDRGRPDRDAAALAQAAE